MNRSAFLLVFLFLSFFLSADSHAIEGFSGSTWGELRYEHLARGEGESDVILRGWVKQGIDWARWGNTKVNTYLTVRYVWDSEKLDWNNSLGPGAGIAIDTYIPKGPYVSWGVEYLWDRFYRSAETEQKVVVFMNWYGNWDLKKK
ncbi:MAG: hypothetical protein AB1552_07375 [Nitrospirota bacterium]